jgi:endo-1,4-beta-xylanase
MGTGSQYDLMWPKPAAGSNAALYQAQIAPNFNLIEEENAGKWAFDEAVRGVPTMQYVDAILQFAKTNGLRVRQHNLLWGQSQPDWAVNLESTALGSDPVAATAAAADLSNAISFRTGYIVTDRAKLYQELDGINEASPGHQPVFLNIYGYPGIATIYNNAINQARATGSLAKVFFNDYNILNNSPDPYAAWYLNFMESVIGAGITPGNRNALGIGIQYYNIGSLQHSPVQIYQSLANLGTLDLPISLTEFGVDPAFAANAPQILADTVRLVFGTDQATTFNTWGFWQPDMWQSGAAFFDQNWNITPSGKVWQQMTGVKNWNLAGVPYWETDVNLTTNAAGAVTLRGFAGDYSVYAGGVKSSFNLAIGSGIYRVQLPL